MALEKSQIKFAKSKETGEIIGFVSSHPKTKKLKGVREDSIYGKKICVLSEHLKGTIIPNVLYDAGLKQMHNQNGYVVVSATPVKFKGHVETIITLGKYQVTVTFGNKKIYFDPINGKSASSRTVKGVLAILKARNDIADVEQVINDFINQSDRLIKRMQNDCVDVTNMKNNEPAN